MTSKSSGAASVQRAIYAELDRQNTALTDIIIAHPQYRSHIATAMLGAAIGLADTFGVDVEGFLAELRRREPKAAVLVPPAEQQS